jgi:signal transduction histidine kinase
MIKLVIRNLLSNAIKFTRHGGKIVISLIEGSNYIGVEVQDNGVGIREADLKKLFFSGSNIKGEGTDKERGSGLGLLLCKEIIEKHNGEIRGESEFGSGSRFIFTIPKKV